MSSSIISKFACLFVIGILGCSSMMGIAGLSSEGINSTLDSESQVLSSPWTETSDWMMPDEKGNLVDIRDQLDIFSEYADTINRYRSSEISDLSSGFNIDYGTQDTTMTVEVAVYDYGIASYDFEEGFFDALVIPSMTLSNKYGSPALPYKKLMFSIPTGVEVLNVHASSASSELIYGLNIVPGPKPVAIYGDEVPDKTLFFDPEVYSSEIYLPESYVTSEIVRRGDESALMITINPLQYSAAEKKGLLHTEFTIDVSYSSSVTDEDVAYYGWSDYQGANYTIITTDDFLPVLSDFIDWKTELGFTVSVETVDDILAGYSGRDAPEKLRTFITASYNENDTEYFLFIGDCDIVPTREVLDPAAGPGLDNGTEPSDLYFECLDGTWDANVNDVFGELDDAVDIFPEVKVGRLPVQLPSEAEHVLTQIISYESNPEAGDWLNDFMLIAVDCFGSGDGVVMTEGEINQKFLFDSFFDVYRYYPTDGSLTTTDIVTKMNSGINIVNFFDHGAYDVWVDALTVDDVLALENGNKSFLAFAMACETAAFDVESVEPTIGEAFFRAPNGGASTYIGATRVAWAGVHCFDGLHNKFWEYFLTTALSTNEVRPKEALQQALNYMATTYDTSVGSTLESIYQAIYFGDPALTLFWKHNVTTIADPVEVSETVTVNGTCLQYNNRPIVDSVDVTVSDPFGVIVYTGTEVTDSDGKYSISFTTSATPGDYVVETYISQPLEYTSFTTVKVGTMDVSLVLDSEPIYHAFLDFSGTVEDDCGGNATIIDSSDIVIATQTFSSSGGVYSGSLNVTDFGLLRLLVQFDNGTSTGTSEIEFKVVKGEVLIIADNAGGSGPDYPGGWADNNFGDASNPGDYVIALQEEYNVTVYFTIHEGAPTIEYLNSFDAVIVTTGDNMGSPLNAPDSYLLDVLHEYHNSNGAIIFEGAAILDALSGLEDERFPNLFHVDYVENTQNTGALELVPGSHPIVSGLPASIPLMDELGTAYADVLTPVNGSLHAAGYGGSYIGGTAIAGLAPTGTLGGVVFIGFSIDGIANDDYRNLLIQNSLGFILNPSLILTVSDDAMMTGTSDTIHFEVTDSATGTPIQGATIDIDGCGVSVLNTTQPDGTCSAIINPTFEGLIGINVTKSGYLHYSTSIIVYDTPIIELTATPSFLERSKSTQVTITATDYYELFPLENCFINITGLGNSETGLTNSSGMIDFILTPDTPGVIIASGELTGYLSSTINIPVRLKIVILPGAGTALADNCCWDELMLHWDAYGDYPLEIDYTTFQNASFGITLENLEATEAQVAYLSLPLEALTESEIEAIQLYVQSGKGFVATSAVMYYNPNEWSTFFGLQETDLMEYAELTSLELSITNTSHPLVKDIPDPYTPGYLLSFYPSGTGWSSGILQGAGYAAVEDATTPQAALTVYRGIVHFSNIPEYMSNGDDCQLVYNAMTWSNYVIPNHDLAVTLDAPNRIAPGDSITLNVTARNMGLSLETNIHVQLYINNSEVKSITIPSLAAGSSESMDYFWTPPDEGIYNVTARVAPILGEDTSLNNVATTMVAVRELHDYTMIEDIFTWYDAVANGYQLSFSGDDIYTTLSLPFDYPFYDGIFDSVALSSNGWLSFGIDNPYDLSGPPFPSSDPRYAYAIAPLWADLIATGNIYIWETPDYFVIQFENYYYLSGSLAGTFQVVFHRSGQLSFNYLSTGSSLHGTVGLNHGDGVHYNSYPIVDLADESAFGLQFYYTLPEHDLSLGLDCPSLVSPSEIVDITMTVSNIGTSEEYGMELELFIDETSTFTTTIPALEPEEQDIQVYHWTASVLGPHNITAVISAIPDEFSLSNNIATQIITVSFLKDYTMIEDTFTWYDAEANGINIGISGDDTSVILDLPFMFPFYDGSFDWIAVSSNGWFSFTNNNPTDYHPPTYPSSNPDYAYSLAPIWADLRADSNVYYWSTSERAVIEFNDYNYLGGSLLGTFEVVLHASGIIEFNYLSMESVSYGIIGLNHGDGVHYNSYPRSSLSNVDSFGLTFSYEDVTPPVWLETPVDFAAQAGQMFTHNFLIQDDGGIETFVVNDTARFSLSVAGSLSNRIPLHVGNYGINITATDYANHSISASLTITVLDTIAPTWLNDISYIQIESGTLVSLNYTASDFSGVASYEVNDTRFEIDENGLLTNSEILKVGNFSIEVSVTDIYNNTETLAISLVIYESTTPTFLFYAILTFASVAIGGLVIILFLRKRRIGTISAADKETVLY
ncbi:MAG: C25 family cysteine peptidase [Candidatus Thorarchaeota archaeon]